MRELEEPGLLEKLRQRSKSANGCPRRWNQETRRPPKVPNQEWRRRPSLPERAIGVRLPAASVSQEFSEAFSRAAYRVGGEAQPGEAFLPDGRLNDPRFRFGRTEGRLAR